MLSSTKRDYIWNTIGVFAQNAISPLLLIAITRINGIHDSGIYSFAFSLALILWAFGMWGGRTYQVSDVRNQFEHRSYIVVRLILAVFMIVGTLFFCALNNYSTIKSGIILTLVLFKVIESYADAIYGILQVHGRLYIVGKSLLYKAVTGFGLFLILDAITKNILLSSVSIVAVNLLFVKFYDRRITKKLEDIHIDKHQINHFAKEAIRIIKVCAPVAAVLILSMFSLNIPRYFIDQYHQEQIGYFGIMAMPITLIALLISFVLQPNVVHLSQLYGKKNYKKFKNTVTKLALITMAVGIIILGLTYLLGLPALRLIFGISFTGYKASLMVLVLGGIINSLVAIFITILIIVRRFKAQFYILLSSNIVLAVFSAAIVRAHGLIGGAYLFTIVNALQLLLLVLEYNLIIKRPLCAK